MGALGLSAAEDVVLALAGDYVLRNQRLSQPDRGGVSVNLPVVSDGTHSVKATKSAPKGRHDVDNLER